MALTSETIINEWRVETEKGVVNVDRLYKKIVQLQREEKKQDVINKALEKAYEDLNRETKMAAELAEKEAAALTAAREAARKSSLEFDNLANSVAKSYTQANKSQTIFGRLSSTIKGSVSGAFSQLSGSMIASITSGNLLAGAITSVGSTILEAVGNAQDYSNAIATFKGNLDDLRRSTGGLATDLDLMNSYNRLAQLGVRLTSDEFTELAGNLTKVAQVMNVDMNNAWESITAALGRGSLAFADNIGVVVKAEEAYDKWALANNRSVKSMTEAEKKIAKQQEILSQLAAKAREIPRLQSTAMSYFRAEWNGFVSELTRVFSTWNDGIGDAIYKIGEFGDEINNLYRTNKWFRYLVNINQGKSPFAAEEEIKQYNVRKLFASAGEAPIKKEGPIANKQPTGIIQDERLANVPEREIKAPKPPKALKPKVALQGITGYTVDTLFGDDSEVKAYKNVSQLDQELERFNELQERQRRLNEENIYGDLAEQFKSIGNAYQQLRESMKSRDQIEQENFGMVFDPKVRDMLDEYKISYMDLLEPMRMVSAEQRIMAASSEQLGETFASSATSMIGGMWSVADQAIQSGESFGMVMLKMIKQHALGLAGQLFADGLKYSFQASAAAATFPSPTALLAPGLYAAAAKSFTGSAAVGALGLGLSFATRGGGGGGSPAASSRTTSGSSSSTSSSSSRSASFARKQSVEAQPIYVQIYMGDQNNPTSALLAKKQVTVLLNQVNQSYSET